MKIGFIGLGNMGRPMAANLASAAHDVTGFDIQPVEIDGCRSAPAIQDAVSGQDAVITMLPDGGALRSVYGEILQFGKSGAVFVDCSTVDVSSARDMADAASQADLLPVDAPVSGGIGGAKAGTLTFMAGGTEEAFLKAKPLFEIMGQKAVHCGASGAGQAAKICNNMILGISMTGVCEAFGLADKIGLDRQKMFDVVSASSGSCWSINSYCPAPGIGPETPADNDYRPGFAAELMLKDLLLAQRSAEESGAATPMGAKAAALYDEFVADGGKGQDFSAMLPWLMKIAGRA